MADTTLFIFGISCIVVGAMLILGGGLLIEKRPCLAKAMVALGMLLFLLGATVISAPEGFWTMSQREAML